jgi:hypothetical protein
VILDLLALRDLQEFKVRLVLKEVLARQDRKDLQVSKDQLGHKVTQV